MNQQMIRAATISPCEAFRYVLARRWGPGNALLFVMLNPSTADAYADDPTIRRCTGFAVAHDFNAFEVVNLFAFRATDPKNLAVAGRQVGPDNDWHIAEAAYRADAICCAWGAIGDRGPAVNRVQAVVPLLRAAGRPLQLLKVTKTGHPSHPLYLSGACRLQDFDAAVAEVLGGPAA